MPEIVLHIGKEIRYLLEGGAQGIAAGTTMIYIGTTAKSVPRKVLGDLDEEGVVIHVEPGGMVLVAGPTAGSPPLPRLAERAPSAARISLPPVRWTGRFLAGIFFPGVFPFASHRGTPGNEP